ncbi:unnamed protein product [Pleuronectes platessa]|uniref:Uncharacterized protein n=1 Tax=Pleuronectes platessa TaxID=8262 RepID=A0A9N7TL60_PLEPL|nr:unnamed protein product [Pleuronectes platessa]
MDVCSAAVSVVGAEAMNPLFVALQVTSERRAHETLQAYISDAPPPSTTADKRRGDVLVETGQTEVDSQQETRRREAALVLLLFLVSLSGVSSLGSEIHLQRNTQCRWSGLRPSGWLVSVQCPTLKPFLLRFSGSGRGVGAVVTLHQHRAVKRVNTPAGPLEPPRRGVFLSPCSCTPAFHGLMITPAPHRDVKTRQNHPGSLVSTERPLKLERRKSVQSTRLHMSASSSSSSKQGSEQTRENER